MSRKAFISKDIRPEMKLDTSLSNLTVKDLIAIVTSPDVIKRIKMEKLEHKELKSEIKEWKEKGEKEKFEKEKPEKERYEAFEKVSFEIDPTIAAKIPELVETIPQLQKMIETLSAEIANLKEKIK